MPAAHVTHKILSTADLIIIGLYFCVVFAIGFYFSIKERTSTDYFLAGRNVGWFAIGASLFVSNISTEHFIGWRSVTSNGWPVSCCSYWAGSSSRSICDPMFSPCRSSWNDDSTGLVPLILPVSR